MAPLEGTRDNRDGASPVSIGDEIADAWFRRGGDILAIAIENNVFRWLYYRTIHFFPDPLINMVVFYAMTKNISDG